ncbi:phospholipase D-like domain-containing protein [Paenibacillus sp. P25]|nr:phospholipase D-like domain-containing protein [Paenibacillus sp. P25]
MKHILLMSSVLLALAMSGCSDVKPTTASSNENPVQPATAGDSAAFCRFGRNRRGSGREPVKATTASTAPTASTMTTTAKTPTQQANTVNAKEEAAAEIEYAFTRANGQPEKSLLRLINGAKKSLDIAVFSLTDKNIVNALIEAKKRGVTVRLITDQQQAKASAQAAQMKALKKAEIPIKLNKHAGSMNLKISIADGSIVTTGSYDYTVSSSKTNDEVLVTIHDAKISKEWNDEFDKMWSDKTNYQDYK